MPIVIDIEAAKPGMVIEEPVVNHRGQKLLAPGATLTERTISVLQRSGVGAVTVQGEEEGGGGKLTKEDLAVAEARLRGRMMAPPKHAAEQELFDQVVRAVARRNKDEG